MKLESRRLDKVGRIIDDLKYQVGHHCGDHKSLFPKVQKLLKYLKQDLEEEQKNVHKE